MKRLQETRRALGSDAYLTLVARDTAQGEQLLESLWQRIAQFEERFSRFLPSSELTRFNNAAGSRQTISTEFRTLLNAAKTSAKQTDGLYNPFILPSLQRAGYKGSWPQANHVQPDLNYETRRMASWRELAIGDDWAKIPARAALDFGGIGKGYLLDELGAWLENQDAKNYWLSLGGDILCNGCDANGEAWGIGIQHALRTDETVAHVTNGGTHLSVATSGITKRKGITPQGAWHHLIDPRTNRPAETDVLTATVCGEHATEADVLAKCLAIAGSAQANAQLKTMHAKNTLLQLQPAEPSSENVKIIKIGNIWSA